MSTSRAALAKRRAELVERATRQRAEIAYHYSHCEPAMRIADIGLRVFGLFRIIRQNPILAAAIAGIAGRLVAGRFKVFSQVSTWSGRLATAWQIFSRVRSAFARPRA